MTGDSVDLVFGHKMEQEIDLSITLTGRDFAFSRHYSSNPRDIDGPSLLGYGWSSPLFQELININGDLVLFGARQNMYTRFVSDGTVWRPVGPSAEYITDDGSLFTLHVPGVGTRTYHKQGAAKGRINTDSDLYGNTWTFQYANSHPSTSQIGASTVRLFRLHLNGFGTNAEALIEFQYMISADGGPNKLYGKLGRIKAFRYNTDLQNWVETHRVEYTYKNEADGFSSDVGTTGDLIQVTKYSRVDSASPRKIDPEDELAPEYGPSYDHRVSVMQYRYHDGREEGAIFSERLQLPVQILGASPGFCALPSKFFGEPHQLKCVIRSEQIEQYAQMFNEGNPYLHNRSYAIRDSSYRLLSLKDSAKVARRRPCSGNPNNSDFLWLDDLPSKIVGYEGTLSSGKVAVQCLQCGCGCGGNTPLTMQSYCYGDWIGPDGLPGKSVHIQEHLPTLSGGVLRWDIHRWRWIDLKKLPGSDAYFGLNDVLMNLDADRTWINHFEYDQQRRLSKVWSPESYLNEDTIYTPSYDGIPPQLASPSGGIGTYFGYNNDNRLTDSGVVNADTPNTLIPLVHIEYGGSGSHEREYLPARIDRYAQAPSGGTPNPDDLETTRFSYDFYSGSDAIKAIFTTQELELPAENGPHDTAGAQESTSIQLFDDQGRAAWSIAPHGTLVRQQFDDRTGRVTRSVFGDSVSNLSANGFFEYAGYASTCNTPLVYETDYDEMGRVRASRAPAPTGVVETQWGYEYQIIRDPRPGDPLGLPYPTYVILPPKMSEAPGRFEGPISIITQNSTRGTIVASTYSINASAAEIGYTPANVSLLLEGQTELSRRQIQRTISGAVRSVTGWNDLNGSLGRPESLRSSTASYEYDSLGRLSTAYLSNGEVQKVEYDVLNRIIKSYSGSSVNDLQLLTEVFYDSNPALLPNLEQGVGNGKIAAIRHYPGTSTGGVPDTRTTIYHYDWRDRLVAVQNPLAPHEAFAYDNLGRVITSASYSGSTPPLDPETLQDRTSLDRFFYSQRGMLYKAEQAIDPQNESGGYLESHRWFDVSGRLIASWGPDAPTSKYEYDALSRIAAVYSTDRGGDAYPGPNSDSWTDASTLNGDVVLSQTQYQYADFGELDFVRSLVRRHDLPITETGVLDASRAVVTYSGYVYDSVGRISRRVEFGTNKAPDPLDRLGDSFTNGVDPSVGPGAIWPPASVPNWNSAGFENHLISAVEYDNRGRVDSVTDPKGRMARYFYDDADEPIAVVRNWTAGGVQIHWDSQLSRWEATGLDGVNTDQNHVTSFARLQSTDSPARWILRQTAHAIDTDGTPRHQSTDYVYGVATGTGTLSSLISTNQFLGEIRYPDETTGMPNSSDPYVVRFAYNALGERIASSDQNGTIHTYLRDFLGRVVRDSAQPYTPQQGDPGLDTRVLAMESTFDSRGLLTDVRSLASVGGSVVDHVRFTYNPSFQLTKIEQDADSDISVTGIAGGHPARAVEYEYLNTPAVLPQGSTALPNTARVVSMGYPSIARTPTDTPMQTKLAFAYGVPGDPFEAVHRAIGRASGLSIVDTPSGGGTPVEKQIAEYSYVGLSMMSHVDIMFAQLDRTVDQTGRRNFGDSPDPGVGPSQTVGAYPGWDRFGRIKRHAWVHTGYDHGLDGLDPATGANPELPNRREYVNFSYLYDRASNPIARRNDLLGAGAAGYWNDRDWAYQYDGLDRLVAAVRGVIGGSMTGWANATSNPALPETIAFNPTSPPLANAQPYMTTGVGSQKWELDGLGNWRSFSLDVDNNFDVNSGMPTFDAFERQGRTHNQANEIGGWVPGGTIPDPPPTITKANIQDSSTGYTYDANGNRTSSWWRKPATVEGGQGGQAGEAGYQFFYQYDAWNRLTAIDRQRQEKVSGGSLTTGVIHPIARYTHNGLNWRTTKQTVVAGSSNALIDIPITSALEAYPKLTHKRVFTHDAAWRAIVEEVDDDALAAPLTGDEPQAGHITGIDRVYHQFFGLRGENDSLYRRGDTPYYVPPEEDPDTGEIIVPGYTAPRPGTFTATPIYQLSDPQLSVVAVVSDGDVSNPAGRTLDTLEYDAYGNVRRGLRADTDRSGKVEVADINNFLSLWFAGTTPGDPNKHAADANEDGRVTSVDINFYLTLWFADNVPFATGTEPRRARLGTGVNGVGSGDNPYGYCGYYFDAETAAAQILGPDTRPGGAGGGGGLYYVRHRIYDPYAGRWLTRDPAGFIDGANLYQYCSTQPISCFDPAGLCATQAGGSSATYTTVPSSGPTGQAPAHLRRGSDPEPEKLSTAELLERNKRQFVAAIGVAYSQGRISKAKYDQMVKNSGYAEYSTVSAWSAFWKGFALGTYEGVILTLNRFTFHLIPGLNRKAGEIWENRPDGWEYRAGQIASWIGVAATYLVGAIFAAEFMGLLPKDGLIQVTRWGRPGLQQGDWVMRGGKNWVNYIFSGKWQWGFGNRFAAYSTGETFWVPAGSLGAPPGWEIIKWILGQRIFF